MLLVLIAFWLVDGEGLVDAGLLPPAGARAGARAGGWPGRSVLLVPW